MINSMPIGELKTHFSEALDFVKKGNQINILFGKKKEPIAVILPYNKVTNKKRTLGLAKHKTTLTFTKDFAITEKELLAG